MNYKIEQLNFLYLYKYCKENHLDVSAYDCLEVEDVIDEDVINILNYTMVKEDISTSYDTCNFGAKVEKYLNQSDTENLAQLGVALSKKVQFVVRLKNDVIALYENTNSKDFIESFELIMSNSKEIRNIISTLNNFKENNDKNNNDRNKKRAVNFLFS